MTRAVVSLLVGGVFGFFLTAGGLGDYETIHRGLLLRDPYIFFMMAATVATAWVGIRLLERRGRTVLGGPLVVPRHPVRRPAVYGAALFGVAFGVGATCPGITVAMLATGGGWGALVLAGIFAGLWLRGVVERRGVDGSLRCHTEDVSRSFSPADAVPGHEPEARR